MEASSPFPSPLSKIIVDRLGAKSSELIRMVNINKSDKIPKVMIDHDRDHKSSLSSNRTPFNRAEFKI